MLPNLSIEGDAGFASTDDAVGARVAYRPVYARLLYAVPAIQRMRVLLGAGYGLTIYGRDDRDDELEDGFAGLAGIRLQLAPSWSLRLEGIADRLPPPGGQPPIGDDRYWNYGVRAGLSWTHPPAERCVLIIEPPAATLDTGAVRAFVAVARGERTRRLIRGVSSTFTSSDGAITPEGVYSARTPGTATVTATARGGGCLAATATARVTVDEPPPPRPAVVGIDVQPADTTVLRGGTVQLRVTGRLSDGRDTVLTASARYSSAHVDDAGRFTANDDTGTVRIRATVGNLSDEASIRVLLFRSSIVTFDVASAALDAEARALLQRIATALQENAAITVRVEAHPDTVASSGGSRRSRRHDDSLSLARADSVTTFLLSAGVDRSRFEPRVRGYSFCVPATPHRRPEDLDTDGQGRALGERANRRVELFELALRGDEQLRWVCRGRPQPLTQPPPR